MTIWEEREPEGKVEFRVFKDYTERVAVGRVKESPPEDGGGVIKDH